MDFLTAELLAKTGLFQGISSLQIIKLFNDLPVTQHKHTKGSIIAFQGDDYIHLIMLVKGKVSAAIHDYSGKTLRVETLEAPTPLASGILFAENPTLPVTITALTEVRTITFSRKTLMVLFSRNDKVLYNFMEDVGNKIVLLADKIALFRFKTLKQKVCGYLLSLEERQRVDSIYLPYNKEILAELFGVARPSLSRILSELEEQGFIILECRTVHLMNKQGIREQILKA